MKWVKTGFLFNRTRTIAYSGINLETEIQIPEQVGIKLPIIAGRFFIINPLRGMIGNYYLGSIPKVNGDYFSVLLDDEIQLRWDEMKHYILLCTEGLDYKFFLTPSERTFIIKVMFLEPEEIFIVPKSEEYFYDYPTEFYQKITIRDGFYSVANDNEEYIGYYVGYSENYNGIAIKLRP